MCYNRGTKGEEIQKPSPRYNSNSRRTRCSLHPKYKFTAVSTGNVHSEHRRKGQRKVESKVLWKAALAETLSLPQSTLQANRKRAEFSGKKALRQCGEGGTVCTDPIYASSRDRRAVQCTTLREERPNSERFAYRRQATGPCSNTQL